MWRLDIVDISRVRFYRQDTVGSYCQTIPTRQRIRRRGGGAVRLQIKGGEVAGLNERWRWEPG